jgi:formylmethanofuran dehydrogenase subunit E
MKDLCLDFETCLSQAAAIHGDVCAGITIGTRMAIAGLRSIGIEDPKGRDRKNIMVFVEVDRCATDAIMAITGCQPGKRTMKIYDYGKMAATFLNLATGKAVRITVREKDREGDPADPRARASLYGTIPENDLLDIHEVRPALAPQDMPGPPVSVVKCDVCGERIMDKREVSKEGRTMCRPCFAGARYYETA